MSVVHFEQDVRDVLINADTGVDGSTVKIHEQLDRKLYLKVNKVLENMGGKWNKKCKAHLFVEDIEDVMDEVVLNGYYEAKLDDLAKIWNFFETPRGLADEMIGLAGLLDGERVLEPSAGRGAIACELSELGHPLWCIEEHPEHAQFLRELGFNVWEGDFLALDTKAIKFNGTIIANPPFSGGRDARHILHMLSMEPRGLVCVAGAGLLFRQDSAYKLAREEIQRWNGTIEPLPPGTFKSSGTDVNAVMVVC